MGKKNFQSPSLESEINVLEAKVKTDFAKAGEGFEETLSVTKGPHSEGRRRLSRIDVRKQEFTKITKRREIQADLALSCLNTFEKLYSSNKIEQNTSDFLQRVVAVLRTACYRNRSIALSSSLREFYSVEAIKKEAEIEEIKDALRSLEAEVSVSKNEYIKLVNQYSDLEGQLEISLNEYEKRQEEEDSLRKEVQELQETVEFESRKHERLGATIDSAARELNLTSRILFDACTKRKNLRMDVRIAQETLEEYRQRDYLADGKIEIEKFHEVRKEIDQLSEEIAVKEAALQIKQTSYVDLLRNIKEMEAKVHAVKEEQKDLVAKEEEIQRSLTPRPNWSIVSGCCPWLFEEEKDNNEKEHRAKRQGKGRARSNSIAIVRSQPKRRQSIGLRDDLAILNKEFKRRESNDGQTLPLDHRELGRRSSHNNLRDFHEQQRGASQKNPHQTKEQGERKVSRGQLKKELDDREFDTKGHKSTALQQDRPESNAQGKRHSRRRNSNEKLVISNELLSHVRQNNSDADKPHLKPSTKDMARRLAKRLFELGLDGTAVQVAQQKLADAQVALQKAKDRLDLARSYLPDTLSDSGQLEEPVKKSNRLANTIRASMAAVLLSGDSESRKDLGMTPKESSIKLDCFSPGASEETIDQAIDSSFSKTDSMKYRSNSSFSINTPKRKSSATSTAPPLFAAHLPTELKDEAVQEELDLEKAIMFSNDLDEGDIFRLRYEKSKKGDLVAQGLGKNSKVPQYLRHDGQLPLRLVPRAELLDLVNEVWSYKLNKEQQARQTVSGEKEPPKRGKGIASQILVPCGDAFHHILKNRYGIQSVVCRWAYNILFSIEHYFWDVDLELFYLSIKDSIPDGTYMDQQLMLMSLQVFLRKLSYLETGTNCGEVSKDSLFASLREIFPGKIDSDFEELEEALHDDQPMSVVFVDLLFDETQDPRKGKTFLNVLKRQHLNEIVTLFKELRDRLTVAASMYQCEDKCKLEDVLGALKKSDENITPHALFLYLSTCFADQVKSEEDAEYVAKFFKFPSSEETTVWVSIPDFLQLLKSTAYKPTGNFELCAEPTLSTHHQSEATRFLSLLTNAGSQLNMQV